jgi:ribosome biogenesis GTPase / thiamine phosphate phosphatase
VSGFFTVATESEGHVICQIAGRLKQGRKVSALVAVGDRVTIRFNEDGSGVIESIAERERVLARSRPAAGFRSILTEQEQVLVANPDQVAFVFSIRKPSPSLRKLDRFLIETERNTVPAIICVNKVDLVAEGEAPALFKTYEDIGYTVLYTSAVRGDGIDALRDHLRNKLTVLAGSSGVGKSSLLNAMQPGLGLKVKAVSQATEKGMHTTRHVELFPLDDGGYIADTPGIRSLAHFDLEPSELDAYFREIAPLVPLCQFSDCTHQHEENCAVRAAVATGTVSPQRYDSYLRLREELEELQRSAY